MPKRRKTMKAEKTPGSETDRALVKWELVKALRDIKEYSGVDAFDDIQDALKTVFDGKVILL
jgi:hypothetical protein